MNFLYIFGNKREAIGKKYKPGISELTFLNVKRTLLLPQIVSNEKLRIRDFMNRSKKAANECSYHFKILITTKTYADCSGCN